MDLLYIWVEKYINIKKQGFCFSGTYDISFDEDKNKVSIEKFKYPIPSDFWGKNISSITAIIGKNGAGKTNLLELILEIFSFKENKSYHLGKRIIAVFGNQGGEFEIVDFDSNSKLSGLKAVILPEKEEIKPILVSKSDSNLDLFPFNNLPLRFLDDTKSVLYSPLFDFRSIVSSQDTIDLSINKSVEEIDESPYREDLGIRNLHILQFQHVDEVISLRGNFREVQKSNTQDRDIFASIQNLIPQYASVICTRGTESPNLKNTLEFEELYKLFFSPEGIIQSMRVYFSNLEDPENGRKTFEDDENSRNRIKFSFYVALIKAIFSKLDDFIQVGGDKHDESFESKINSLTLRISKMWEVNDSFEVFEQIADSLIGQIPNRVLPDRQVFLDLFSSLAETISTSISNSPYSFLIDLDKDFDLRKLFQNNAKYLRIFDQYRRRDVSFISFDWHKMSSGEKAFLRFFSKLNVAKNICDKKQSIKKIVLLIDEGEVGFHPQWQREYMHLLTRFLEEFFRDYKIQIFLTSHSPILISDFPKQSVIFLDKNEVNGDCILKKSREMDTFAANIHSLFADSFFLNQEGRKGYLIGEFSYQKVNEIIDLLNRDNISDEKGNEIINLINLIDEPIIANKLREMAAKFPSLRELMMQEELRINEERIKRKYLDPDDQN